MTQLSRLKHLLILSKTKTMEEKEFYTGLYNYFAERKFFYKTTGYIGIFGTAFMLLYITFIPFIPAMKNMATLFTMPGGLLLIIWLVFIAIKLFKLGYSGNSLKNSFE